jgi:hypothetical protein
VVTPLRPPTRPLPEPAEEDLWLWQPDNYMFRLFHEHPNRPPLLARTFGPLNRFDPHVRDRRAQPRDQRDGRGANYLSVTLACALAEAFPDERPEVAICPSARVVLAAPATEIRLLDLTGDGAMKIGAVGTLGSGNEPRRLTQRWARAIYEDYPAVTGIRYRAAHQGGIAIAVWDRAGALRVPPGTLAAPRALLDASMADRVLVALASQGRYPVRIAPSSCRRCREASAATR